MSDDLLPAYVSVPMAAELSGRSIAAIKRLIGAGIVPADGKTWLRIKLADVAGMLGRPVTAEDYLRADRARDRARGKRRVYNAARPR
jgi:hypothetical protein